MNDIPWRLFILLCFPFLSLAQIEDYVVMNNNQKILGEIREVDFSINKGRVVFKTPDAPAKTYYADDLQEWERDGKAYISTTRPGRGRKRVFLERLTEADRTVIVYEYTNKANPLRSSEVFLARRGQLTIVRFLSFRIQMRSYFADEPEVVALIDNRDVKKRDLLALVEEYNDTVEESNTEPGSRRLPPSRSNEEDRPFWNFNDLLLSTDEAARKYMEALQNAVSKFKSEQDPLGGSHAGRDLL